MDPFSIATAVGAATQTLYSVSTALYSFITSAKRVDTAIEALHNEVKAVEGTSRAVKALLEQPALTQKNHDLLKPDGVLASIAVAVNDTQKTSRALEKVLRELGVVKGSAQAVKKALKQFQLKFKTEDINNLRNRFHTHASSLQISLQSATLLITCQSKDYMLNAVIPKLDDIIPEVQRLIRERESDLDAAKMKGTDMALPEDFRNPSLYYNSYQLTHNVEAVLSAASTVAESEFSGKGKNKDQGVTRSSSVFREPLPKLKQSSLDRWLSNLAISEQHSMQSTPHLGRGQGQIESRRPTSLPSFVSGSRSKSAEISVADPCITHICQDQNGFDGSVICNEPSAKRLLAALDLAPDPKGSYAGEASSIKTFWCTHPGCRNVLVVLASIKPAQQGFRSSSNIVNTIRYVLERGADVNKCDRICHARRSPLDCACEHGISPIVEILCEYGANINAVSNTVDKKSALHNVSSRGHTAIVKILCKRGAIVDIMDSEENTALLLAAILGYTSVAKVLLEHGANIDHKNRRKATALHLAIQYGRTEMVELLLDADADTEASGLHGFLPIHEAASNGRVEEAELLIKSGIDINATTNDGFTPLALALKRGHKAMVEFLLSHKALRRKPAASL
ncbi:hypothetical protein ACLMJK_002717 [Lecanora helva]